MGSPCSWIVIGSQTRFVFVLDTTFVIIRRLEATMASRYFIILLVSILLISPGCLEDNESEDEGGITTIDPNHPFAGEWTAQYGYQMYFFEYENSCSAEWNVDTDTATHIIDCTDSTGIKTTNVNNYSFVGNVLFMQGIQSTIEYDDPSKDTVTADTSITTICAAYVPRDIAADEASWTSEVNSVTWPTYCTQIVGLEATSNSQTANNYVGFLDNSSIYGLEINPIEDFSRIYAAMNEENCTSSESGDWLGVWNDPWCTTNFGENVDSVTHQNGELCFENDNDQGCWNMTVSNRVMWLQGDLFGGQEDICAVYIQSEQFTPTGAYNLSVNTVEGDDGYIPVDWDDLWADPDYTTWENERMSAYNAESANQPDWCSEPIFDWLHWASSPAE